MVTDRDKIVASDSGWRSALNGVGSKAFTLLKQCLIQVVNRQSKFLKNFNDKK